MSLNEFIHRHIGPGDFEKAEMLNAIGVSSLEELIEQTIPPSIRLKKALNISAAMSEYEYLAYIREIGKKNKLYKTYIGQGYYNTVGLAVVKRNILENPSWYTSYTPYQAEISQGRLEALLNFQTMITGLTGMELANASLLDESTAAAEAMIMMYNLRSRAAVKEGVNKFFIDKNVFPQTFSVMETRAVPLGIELVTAGFESFQSDGKFFGCLVQYPDSQGEVRDYKEFVDRMHQSDILVGVAADLMGLALLVPPGEWGADMVLGSSQRFGVPLGYGGPHAAYFATKEKFKRNIPGRIIGVSIDASGNQALRMALQTREQHIKREKATSNICTAQALLAIMAGMYAVYHGPEGIKSIASSIHFLTKAFADAVTGMNYEVLNKNYFDTLKIKLPAGVTQDELIEKALHLLIGCYIL